MLDLRLEDRTQQDIAEQMHVSERTVRRALHRIEARLRDALS